MNLQPDSPADPKGDEVLASAASEVVNPYTSPRVGVTAVEEPSPRARRMVCLAIGIAFFLLLSLVPLVPLWMGTTFLGLYPLVIACLLLILRILSEPAGKVVA
jgi:hypothetical protein